MRRGDSSKHSPSIFINSASNKLSANKKITPGGKLFVNRVIA